MNNLLLIQKNMQDRKGPQAPRYADMVKMEQAAAVRARLEKARESQRKQVKNALECSQLAQERLEALENYPHLKKAVTITNSGIRVQTDAGEMRFGFEQMEGGVKHADANAEYTKDQLHALVELFGNEKNPYMEILGLKDTHRDDGEEFDYNFYWSSSVHLSNDDFAWGLLLDSLEVFVYDYYRTLEYSAFNPEN